MWKPAKAFILPTSEESNLCLSPLTNNLFYEIKKVKSGHRFTNQYIYIVNDDVIKKWDWFFHKTFGKLQQWLGEGDFPFETGCFKVIATNDTSLHQTNFKISPVPNFCDYPSVSQKSMELFVSEYNVNENKRDSNFIFIDVLVEYDNNFDDVHRLEDFEYLNIKI